MLSIGPASSCDICYEGFGQDTKAPWSIECGHVFCGECIQNIDDPRLCPMCRSPFDRDSCIKLHVDLDLAPGEPSSIDAADLKEARRIQHAIASIPETGATEPSLRQLIQEGNKFLASKPRNTHKDLRSAHRMIAYLYDVKMQHRAQAQAIDSMKEQANQLRQEKDDLQQQVEKLEETRQYESETAAAVENTLREHCAQAKQAQKASSEQLKKLNEENEDLKKRVKFLMGNLTSRPAFGASEQQETYPIYKTIPPSVFNKLDMASVAIQDSSSFLISPLPQFTSGLPAMFDSFASLPELAEDVDEARDSSDEEDDSDEEVLTPDSSQQQLGPSESREIAPQFAPELIQPVRPPARGPLEPSGLSRTAPYRDHRRERSYSNPVIRSSSRSHSPFDNVVTSTSPIPPVQTTNHSSPSRDTYAPPPSHDGNVLRSRLQDILSDSPTSSSLPTLSSSFPSSLTRDASAAHNDNCPQAGTSRSSEALAAAAPQQIPTNTSSCNTQPSSSKPRSTSPNHLVGTRMSSASAEAKKLEDERRRRHREEKYGQDHDRQSNDLDRDSRRYTAPSNLSNMILGTSSASHAARREQQPYGNPLNPNLKPTLKRSSTLNSASYGRSGLSLQSTLLGQEQGPATFSRPFAISGSKANTVPATYAYP